MDTTVIAKGNRVAVCKPDYANSGSRLSEAKTFVGSRLSVPPLDSFIEIGLIGAVVMAVLAFGGTQVLVFSAVEFVVLGLAFLVVASHGASGPDKPAIPIVIPVCLVAIALFQIIPLPISLLRFFHITGSQLDGATSATVSVAPYETQVHLLHLLTYFLTFYLTLVVCRRPMGSKRLIFTLTALGIFEAAYGLLQYFTGWQQIFDYKKTFYVDEATGTYINRNHYAGFLEMILPFALALLFLYTGELFGTGRDTIGRVKKLLAHEEFYKPLLWMFLSVVLFVALVFSRSRMGTISAVASALLIFTLMARSKLRSTPVILALLFLLTGIAAVIWIGPDPVVSRYEAWGQESAGRWGIWQDTVKLIRQHWLLGSGLGTFALDYPSVQSVMLTGYVSHAHNDYLEAASEFGVPGALLLFGGVFWVLRRSIRSVRCDISGYERSVALGCSGAVAAILLHSLTDFNLAIPANALVFAMILGMAYASNSRSRTAVG
jgi:putative inorganic carbon (hco3(-)) transporter